MGLQKPLLHSSVCDGALSGHLPVWGGIVLIAHAEGSLKQTPKSPHSFQLKTSDNQSSLKSICGIDTMWLRNLSTHSKAAAQGTSAVA